MKQIILSLATIFILLLPVEIDAQKLITKLANPKKEQANGAKQSKQTSGNKQNNRSTSNSTTSPQLTSSNNTNINEDLIMTQDIMTIPMQRKDLNGNICALLKVMVTKKGLSFEGNVIGSVEQKNGNQYWVYLSPGTKKIKINVPGEKTKVLDLDEYPDFPAFESKRIYEYSFETTPTQKLNLTYSPQNAMILIDGNLYDGLNGEIHVDLPLGEHSYMVVAKGFVTSEGVVKLTANGQSNINVNLDPAE